MTKLGQTKREHYEGDYVLNSLEMGTEQGFSKVAKDWLKKCISFDDARDVLNEQHNQVEDFHVGLKDWECIAKDDGVYLRNRSTCQEYRPTEHAINNLCAVGRGMSTWAVKSLMSPIQHPTKKTPIKGGERKRPDYEVLRDYINVHLFNSERVDQEKTRLMRTWKNGTFRALLSNQYIIVNNSWYLDVLSELIPGGMVSHWRGNADEVYGNILIPDTIREEDDSDFGGMLSVGNSEIGTRRISSIPSVFRAICMNGCIYDAEKGEEIRKVHRGKDFSFEKLKAIIRENLESQIPLLPDGIQRVLGLRAYGCGDISSVPMIAQVASDYNLTKVHCRAIYNGWQEEMNILGNDDGRTAYGLMNGITRAGQQFDNSTWVRFDEIGGSLTGYSQDDWNRFRKRAGNMSAKQVEKRVGELAAV